MSIFYLIAAFVIILLPYIIKRLSKNKSGLWLSLAIPIDVLIPIRAEQMGLIIPVSLFKLGILTILIGFLIMFVISYIKAYMKPVAQSLRERLEIQDYLIQLWLKLSILWFTIVTLCITVFIWYINQ